MPVPRPGSEVTFSGHAAGYIATHRVLYHENVTRNTVAACGIRLSLQPEAPLVMALVSVEVKVSIDIHVNQST